MLLSGDARNLRTAVCANVAGIGRGGALAIAIVVACVAAYLPVLNERYGDFRAFYCSGRALLAGADPYREHPLRECENAVAAPGVSPGIGAATVPVPFPGYVIAAFAALAHLPFGLAAALWLIASCSAVALACRLFARSIAVPLPALVALTGFPAVVAALQLGQITPLVLLSLSAAAWLLRLEKPVHAAWVALPLVLEPQIAAGALLALFIGEAKSRLPLLAGGTGIAVLWISTVGLPETQEYLRDVLPAHASANLFDVQQYSAAHVAALAGVAPGIARTIGSCWYGIATSLGIVFALRLRTRFGAPALVLIPAACEVFGGVYVHMAQLAFAIPAFLLIAPRAGRWRMPVVAAIFVAAMPWNLIGNYPMFVPAVAALAVVVCTALRVERMASGLATASALAIVMFFATGVLVLTAAAHKTGAFHPPGNPLAQVSWGQWQAALSERRNSAALAWSIAVQIPTFLAMTTLIGTLVASACGSKTRSAVGSPDRLPAAAES